MRNLEWSKALDDLPTQCSRRHETVEMINYDRSVIGEGNGEMKFFCPSCHQKLKMRIRKASGGTYAATGYEILDNGDI